MGIALREQCSRVIPEVLPAKHPRLDSRRGPALQHAVEVDPPGDTACQNTSAAPSQAMVQRVAAIRNEPDVP